MASGRFDRSKWDDLRIIRWALLPTVLLALLLFPARVAVGNAEIPTAQQKAAVAAMADSHCLDTPGPHHFILCRQRVSFVAADGTEVTAAVTLTQEFFEAHLSGLPILYDAQDPMRVRPTDAPGFWWFFLDEVVKVGILAVPSTFLAFALGILLSKRLRLRQSLG